MINLDNELKNSFKSLVHEIDHISIEIKIPFLSYFIGHFPNNPILPAVGLLDISIYLINCSFFKNSARQPIEIKQLKIIEKVTPHQILTVDIERQNEHFKLIWKTATHTSAEVYLKF